MQATFQEPYTHRCSVATELCSTGKHFHHYRKFYRTVLDQTHGTLSHLLTKLKNSMSV